MSSTEERRFTVLRAIVADYVSTKEPIGSKTLVDRHNLGVSSATVRNDMAVLEAEGYITQTHTSSGRVPTDKGYRQFVDRIAEVKPLSSAERRAILQFLESGVDLDDVLPRGEAKGEPAVVEETGVELGPVEPYRVEGHRVDVDEGETFPLRRQVDPARRGEGPCRGRGRPPSG